MTIDPQETHILNLVHQLPLLRRIRLALTILREVEPTQIPVEENLDEVSFYKGDEELAERLLSRKEAYLKGEGKTISRQELIAKIYSEISSNS